MFGPLYYLFKGMWLWAILSLITANGLWIGFPLYNRAIVLRHYHRKGWVQRMTMSAPTQPVCYPSGTQRATLTSTAKADRMKRLSDLAPARTRQTDT